MTRLLVVILLGCSAKHASTPPPSDADVDGPSDTANACRPVQYFAFTSAATVPLGCDGNAPVAIMTESIPATGRAVARGNFTVHHTGTNAVTHFWNVAVSVGSPMYAFGLGDDVCPGTTSTRANLGSGTLAAAADHVTLLGYEGAAPCTPGTLEVEAGAVLEVWVEDPACAGADIAFGSYYGTAGYTTPYDWTTSFTALPGTATSLATTAATENLRVLAVVEGSPGLDPNTTCGNEASTIDLETELDGAVMTYQREVVPASQGMGHRVLYTSGDVNEIRAVTPGMHTATLLVASDFVEPSGFNVTTGGCCGDGEIALIRLR